MTSSAHMDERETLLPGHHHPLRRTRGSFCCALCDRDEADDDEEHYYHCTTCNVGFHSDCAENTPKTIHPYHPTHPLTFHRNWGSPQYPNYEEKCSLCFEVMERCHYHFRCSICDFTTHGFCCMKYVRPLIDHPECHEHKLFFQPEHNNISFTCHVCGLTHSDHMPHCECVEPNCGFEVHEDCIYLPRAVKITSHQHRLSRVDHLPKSGEWSCEICHGGFDPHYGAYFCNIEGCSSAIHLRCAMTTQGVVWDDDENPKKPALDPVLPPIHPHTLRLKPGRIKSCEMCHQANEADVSYFYYCELCQVEFHRGCAESSPIKIKHPFHTDHPLRLGFGPPTFCQGCSHSYATDMHHHYYCDLCNVQFHAECGEVFPEIKYPFHPKHPLTLITSRSPVYSGEKCYLCGKGLKEFLYHCSICNFSVDILCAKKPPPLDIDHSKSHKHRLTLLPRLMMSFTCDACGLVGDRFPYVCYRCDFMVHRDCVDLPRVIKITRHQHRLFHTSSLPWGKWSCGVCWQEVDGKYGVYSCNYKGCTYVAHPKCATNNDVWDGKELEGEADEPEDVKSFTVKGVGIINHCSHEEHDLRLNKDSSTYDEEKRCKACTLHVLSGPFYSCTYGECHFILHEKCANLPRKIQHMLHRHPLTLHFNHMRSEDFEEYSFKCTACDQGSSGFKYKCLEMGCDFELDARCASISEPFIHGCHEHPLFFPLYDNTGKGCRGCGEESNYMLNCVKCDFVLEFRCATLPPSVRYRYDEHLLSICSNGEASGWYWCEICEEEMDPKKWFYTCEDCGIISHIECTLGKLPFICRKPGQSLKLGLASKIEMVSTNRIPRQLCCACRRHCLDTIAFKLFDKYFCSIECFFIFYEIFEFDSDSS